VWGGAQGVSGLSQGGLELLAGVALLRHINDRVAALEGVRWEGDRETHGGLGEDIVVDGGDGELCLGLLLRQFLRWGGGGK
jgi:hypothetical protein